MMKAYAHFFTIVLSLLAAIAPSSRGEQPQVATDAAAEAKKPEPAEWGSTARLHRLGGLFFASQPAAEDFAQARKDGVKTVINLRRPEEMTGFNEAEVVEGLGMKYISLPWNGPEELTDEVFDKSRELLKTAERPILLHCSSSNRVGAVWLPYRVLDEGAGLDEAVAEAKVVGLRTPAYETKARDYIERHRAEP